MSFRYLSHAIGARWQGAAVVSSVVFAGIAAYVFSLTPEYTSTALVLLAAETEALDSTAAHGTPTDPFFIRSEAAIAASDGLGRAVIGRLRLDKLPEFLPGTGVAGRLGFAGKHQPNPFLSSGEVALDDVLRHYREQLAVFNDGRSKTLEIAFSSSDPRLAASIANAHAEAYLDEQSKRRLGAQQKTVEWLAREVDARAAEVRDADMRVQQYRSQHGIVNTKDATLVEQRLSQLSTQLIEARRQLATQKALLSEIRQIRTGADPGSAVAMLADEPFKYLLQSRVEKESSVASLQERLAANHPTLIEQRQALASIDSAIDKQLLRMESESTRSASLWQRQVDDLDRAVSDETTSKFDEDRATAALPALLGQAQVKRSVFETVLNRYQTLLAESAFAAPSASIVSAAVPSARPSFPKSALFLTIAAMASMLAGAVAAVFLYARSSTAMGLASIADALGVRPLAAIPRFRNASRVSGAIRMKDPGLFIESIRFLRDATLERLQSFNTTTCLVTSVLPRQGKSLVAMSLARAIARAGRKTLFVEFDLRQPTGSSLAKQAPPSAGIAAVLEGRAVVRDVVIRDDSTGLDMLLAETHAASALDCLTTGRLKQLFVDIRGEYEAIIIDSPPVGIVSDALALACFADETLVVAKDGDSSIEELRRGVRLLRDSGALVAGLVLTSVDPNDMSSIDRKTRDQYVMGVPENVLLNVSRANVPAAAELETAGYR